MKELQGAYLPVTVMEKLQQPEKVSNILPGIAGVIYMLSLAVSTSPLIVTCTISATPVHEGQLARIPETIGSSRNKSIMVTEGSICLKYAQFRLSLTKRRQRHVKLRSMIMTDKALLQVLCLGILLILKCPNPLHAWALNIRKENSAMIPAIKLKIQRQCSNLHFLNGLRSCTYLCFKFRNPNASAWAWCYQSFQSSSTLPQCLCTAASSGASVPQ